MTSVSDPIWYKDISILWNEKRLTEFFPQKDHTLEEKLNSIVRLSIYCTIVLYFYSNNKKYIYLTFGSLLLTYFVYSNKEKKLEKLETFQPVIGGSVFDNKSQDKIQKPQMQYTKDDKQCTPPTIDNPFMNATMKDFLNINEKTKMIVDRPPACDINDPETKKRMDQTFNNNLFKDVNDVFGKMNSQRQFYTMPSTTIPNAQTEFAKWLYLNPKTCKEDQDYCNPYEDLRAKRPVVYDSLKNPIKKE